MTILVDNWAVVVALGAVAVTAAVYLYRFAGLPTGEQLGKVKEWLLWEVTEAEKELGGGTGQLKLRRVYDRFVERFPALARVISFARFSALVDDALDEMRDMLAKNTAAADFVGVTGNG